MSKWILLIVVLSTARVVTAEDRAMAVTIDDLPFVMVGGTDPELLTSKTGKLVQCLSRHGIPAVGFVNEGALYREGRLDPGRVELLQAWLRTGLELGNHTHSHLSLNRVTLDTFLADVVRGEEVTRPLSAQYGQRLRWFRHPYLHLGPNRQVRMESLARLAELGYAEAPVTINSAEWVFAAAYARALAEGDEATAARVGSAWLDYMGEVIRQAEESASRLFGRPIRHVLLSHANALNGDCFCSLVSMLKRRGYRFVSLDEALEDKAYSFPLPDREMEGYSWLDRWMQGAGFPPTRQVTVPEFVTRLAASLVGRKTPRTQSRSAVDACGFPYLPLSARSRRDIRH